MNVAQVAKAIERIVEGQGTKADRARALFDLGCDRSDVVELLGMSYSQAHSLWKQRAANGLERSDNHASAGVRADRNRRTPKAARGLGLDVPQATGEGGAPTFFLSPSQVRYITQSGHVIVRVDARGGPECRHCGSPLDFSLRHLGFVHKGDFSEPTDMQDVYPGE